METRRAWQLAENTIYRKVSDELVVIQLETGEFFYFNPPTQKLLEDLKTPKHLDGNARELEDFCEFLTRNRILKQVDCDTSAPLSDGFEFKDDDSDPTFLRKGEKKLDEITFLCP